MPSKKPVIHQMTVAQWEAAFPDEDACCAYLVAHRWPAGVSCPRCGVEVSFVASIRCLQSALRWTANED